MRAFSLIEMMVVAAILGTVAAIAVPNFGESIRRANEPQEAARVSAFVTQARNTARRGNRCVRLVLDSPKALRFETFHQCVPPALCECPSSSLADVTGALALSASHGTLTLTAPASILPGLGAEPQADRLIFLSSGATPYASDGVVQYTMPSGRRRTVAVMPAAGIIRVRN